MSNNWKIRVRSEALSMRDAGYEIAIDIRTTTATVIISKDECTLTLQLDGYPFNAPNIEDRRASLMRQWNVCDDKIQDIFDQYVNRRKMKMENWEARDWAVDHKQIYAYYDKDLDRTTVAF